MSFRDLTTDHPAAERSMKHFRIGLHTMDPDAYEHVLELGKRLADEINALGGAHGYYVEVVQWDDHFEYPMIGNEALEGPADA